jgi:hypothetical protein
VTQERANYQLETGERVSRLAREWTIERLVAAANTAATRRKLNVTRNLAALPGQNGMSLAHQFVLRASARERRLQVDARLLRGSVAVPARAGVFLHEGGQLHVYCLYEADKAKWGFGGEDEKIWTGRLRPLAPPLNSSDL